MKFRGVKSLVLLAVEEAVKELQLALQDLFIGLRKMNFEDNFDSFSWTGTIGAGNEVEIKNKLQLFPTKYIVVRNSSGMAIGDGPTTWSSDSVYLKNYGGSSATITVVFMR